MDEDSSRALKKVATGQGVVRGVVSAVVSYYGSPLLGAATQVMSNVNEYSAQRMSWDEAWKRSAISLGTAALSSYLNVGSWYSFGDGAVATAAEASAAAATNAAVEGAVSSAVTGNFTWQNYLANVGGAAVSGAIGGATGAVFPSTLASSGFSYGGFGLNAASDFLGGVASGYLEEWIDPSGLSSSDAFDSIWQEAAMSTIASSATWYLQASQSDALISTIPKDLWASADAEKRKYLLGMAGRIQAAEKDKKKVPGWDEVDSMYLEHRAAPKLGFVDRYSDTGSVSGALANAAIAKFSPFDYEARSVATSPGKYYDSEGDRIAFGVNPGFLTRIGRSIAKAYPDWMFHGKLPNFGEVAQYTGRTAYDPSGASVLEIDPSIQVGAGAAQAHSTNVSDLQLAYRLGGISSGFTMRLGPGAVQSSSGAALRLRAARILGGSSIR